MTATQIGASARRTRTVTRRDIELFTEITGDRNPIHYDEELAGSAASAGSSSRAASPRACSTRSSPSSCPGPGSVFLEVSWRFLAPVRPGDVITAQATVTAARDDKPVTTPGHPRDQPGRRHRARRHRRRLAGPGRGIGSRRAGTAPLHPQPGAGPSGTDPMKGISNDRHHREPAHQRRRHRDPVRHPRRRQGPARDRQVPVPRAQHLGQRHPQPVRRSPASSARPRRWSTSHVTVVDSDHPAVLVGAGPRPDAGGVPAPRHRRLPHRRRRQHRRRPRRRSCTRSPRPSRATSTCSASSGCPTAPSATATSRSRSPSTSRATPTTRRCAASSSSRAAARPSTTCSPTPRPSSSTWSPADLGPTTSGQVVPAGTRRPAGTTGPPGESMTTIEKVDTVVIGAGHAGLAVSRLLTDAGRDHVVLDRGRVGERWRTERWDSLHLLTPSWMTRLPGWQYDGPDPDGFLSAAEFVGHLERYAASFDAPVVGGTTVLSVSPARRRRLRRRHGPRRPGAPARRRRHRPARQAVRAAGAGRHADVRGRSPPARTATPRSSHRAVSSSWAPRRRACRSPTSSPAPAARWCSPSAGTPGCRAATAAWTSSGGWRAPAGWPAPSTRCRTPRLPDASRRCSWSVATARTAAPPDLDLAVAAAARGPAGRTSAVAVDGHGRDVRRRPPGQCRGRRPDDAPVPRRRRRYVDRTGLEARCGRRSGHARFEVRHAPTGCDLRCRADRHRPARHRLPPHHPLAASCRSPGPTAASASTAASPPRPGSTSSASGSSTAATPASSTAPGTTPTRSSRTCSPARCPSTAPVRSAAGRADLRRRTCGMSALRRRRRRRPGRRRLDGAAARPRRALRVALAGPRAPRQRHACPRTG